MRGLGHAVGSHILQTVEIFSVEETPNPGVVAVSDAVGVNIHPFYDFTLEKKYDPKDLGVSAAERFKLKLGTHRANFPGKKIIVTEVGWPSSSDIYSGDTQLGSDMAQLYFVQVISQKQPLTSDLGGAVTGPSCDRRPRSNSLLLL